MPMVNHMMNDGRLRIIKQPSHGAARIDPVSVRAFLCGSRSGDVEWDTLALINTDAKLPTFRFYAQFPPFYSPPIDRRSKGQEFML